MARCLKILGHATDSELASKNPPSGLRENTILYQNWRTLRTFREMAHLLRDRHGIDIPVKITYIPGNHDRLVNVYAPLRERLCRLMGLTVDAESCAGCMDGSWRFKYRIVDRDHGLVASHGHEHDIWNFQGGPEQPSASGDEAVTSCIPPDTAPFLETPVGDIFTTEFAVKIPWAVRNLKSKYPEITDRFIEKLRDIDNVRPFSRVMEWIYYRMRSESSQGLKDAFEEAFNSVLEDVFCIPYIRKWSRKGTGKDGLLRLAANPVVNWLTMKLNPFGAESMLPAIMKVSDDCADPQADPYAGAAYREKALDDDAIHFVVYGHTHYPQVQPLDLRGSREIFYINTGTWRSKIVRTVPADARFDFLEMKQMTYASFFTRDEDADGKRRGSPSFELWSGTKKKFYA